LMPCYFACQLRRLLLRTPLNMDCLRKCLLPDASASLVSGAANAQVSVRATSLGPNECGACDFGLIADDDQRQRPQRGQTKEHRVMTDCAKVEMKKLAGGRRWTPARPTHGRADHSRRSEGYSGRQRARRITDSATLSQ
jgi:hypothetical protein